MSRITVLSLLIIVGALVSYIFYLNPGAIEVAYRPGRTVSAPLALILISIFSFGFLLASAIAFLIAARQSWQRWRESQRARQFEAHQQLIVNAREELAAGNLAKARAMFQRIVDQDPKNIVGRILLAETYQRQADLHSALRILDQCRAEQRENLELLFLAARINSALGNHTAACDNLSLVLKTQPNNAAALEALGAYSFQLGRLDQARDYYSRLIKVTPAETAQQVQDRLALAELALASKTFDPASAEHKRAIEEVLKRHRDFPPALAALAELEREGSRLDLAIKLWIRAFKFSGDPAYLDLAAQTWLKIDQPARALEAVKNGVVARSADSADNSRGRLYLIAMLLKLEMVEDAQAEIDSLAAALPAEQPALQYLRAKALFRRGEAAEAIKRLYSIIDEIVEVPGMLRQANGAAPERIPLLTWHQQKEQPDPRPLAL